MRINIVSIFPDFFSGPLGLSIPARAAEAGLVEYSMIDLRDYTHDRHKTVDDLPYGGGAGMVMKPEPFFEAIDDLRPAGPIVLLYLLFHLADLTWGWWLGDDYVRGDIYHNVNESLSSVPVAIIYVVANVVLAIHIFHGAWSMFQSLGMNHPRFNPWRKGLAIGLAALVFVGNSIMPIAVMAGWVS